MRVPGNEKYGIISPENDDFVLEKVYIDGFFMTNGIFPTDEQKLFIQTVKNINQNKQGGGVGKIDQARGDLDRPPQQRTQFGVNQS